MQTVLAFPQQGCGYARLLWTGDHACRSATTGAYGVQTCRPRLFGIFAALVVDNGNIYGWFACDDAPVPRHLVGMDKKDSSVAALVVDNGRLCTRMVLLVRCIMRCVSSAVGKMLGIFVGWTRTVMPCLSGRARRRPRQWHGHGWFMVQTFPLSGRAAEDGCFFCPAHQAQDRGSFPQGYGHP